MSVCVTGLVFYSSELHKVQNNVDKYEELGELRNGELHKVQLLDQNII